MPIMEQIVFQIIEAIMPFKKFMKNIWLDSLLRIEGNHHPGFVIGKPFECILKIGKEYAI